MLDKFFKKSTLYLIVLSIFIYSIFFIVGSITTMTLKNSDSANNKVDVSLKNPLFENVTIDTYHILLNNMTVVFLLAIGSFLLGLPTCISLIFNGFSLGAQISTAIIIGIPPQKIILLTVPHAIFEIPGFWIAGAAGFKIPYELLCFFTNKKNYIINYDEMKEFVSLICMACTLIFIAAIIEANLTINFV